MQIRFKDSDRAGKTSLVFNMGMPCPSSHLSKDLCTGAYAVHSPFLPEFSFRKNQQMELQGSPHAEPHSCACALGRMEDTRSRGELPKKKAVQRSSAGRWWERNRLQFTRSYWAHQHETSAFDSNAKAGNAIILHKIWRHLFDPDYSFITALAQHLVVFHAYVLVELVEKNFFFSLLHAIQMRQC